MRKQGRLDSRKVLWLFIWTILAQMAIHINPACTRLTDLFRTYDYRDILLFIGTGLFLAWSGQHTEETGKRKGYAVASIVFAFFLAFILITGDSLLQTDSLKLAFGSKLRCLGSCIRFVGYVPLFYHVFLTVFTLLERWLPALASLYPRKPAEGGIFGRYLDLLERRPFLVSFVTMWLLYLPIVFICYPAIFMGDTGHQLAQAYNAPDYIPYVRLMYEDSKMFNHHPVVHTLLLYYSVRVGHALTGSYNFGAFVYCLIQVTTVFACYAWVMRRLIQEKISSLYLVWSMLYLLFLPLLMHTYMVVTKDGFYLGFLMVFVMALYRLMRSEPAIPDLLVSTAGMLAFRKEAVYLLLITFFVLFLLRMNDRRLCILFMIGIVVTHLAWGHILLPAAGISPGSKREMLSMPFQMTARYVIQYGDEVTEEERAAIDRVLIYDEMLEEYEPTHCLVKKKYREEATTSDLLAYTGAFCRMFIKHPVVYVVAALNFKYRYFYPSTIDESSYNLATGENKMAAANAKLRMVDVSFNYPTDAVHRKLRTVLLKVWQLLCELPVLRILYSTSTYIWSILILGVYALMKRDRQMMALLIPFLLTILVIMAGPRGGGHARYILPITACMPVILILLSRLAGTEQRTEV